MYPCDHAEEADPACQACRHRTEAEELADQWDKGIEQIPRLTPAHALQILEACIQRRALVTVP